MERTTTRATFLKHSVTFTGLAFAGPALLALGNPRLAGAASAGYGPLKPVGAGHLALPEGFTYKILRQEGDLMSDGHRVPAFRTARRSSPTPTIQTCGGSSAITSWTDVGHAIGEPGTCLRPRRAGWQHDL